MNEHAPRSDRGQRALVAAAVMIFGLIAFTQAGAPGTAAEFALQATPPPPEHLDTTLVNVNGSGSVQVPPDQASVVVGVDVERPTLAEAQAEATTQASAVIEALKAAGVAEEDVQTTDFNVRVVRERDRERDEEDGARGEEEGERGSDGTPRDAIRGFQVTNAIVVTVRDLDSLGRILDNTIAAGANEVRNISFSLADPDEATAIARTQSIDDARTKAEQLAAAAGMSVSRVVTISETFSPRPEPRVFATANGGSAIADASSRDVPIAIGTDEISVEVQVTYELS